MGELLKQVSKEYGNEHIRTQLRHFGLVFLDHREVIAQEAVYRVATLMPFKQLTEQKSCLREYTELPRKTGYLY